MKEFWEFEKNKIIVVKKFDDFGLTRENHEIRKEVGKGLGRPWRLIGRYYMEIPMSEDKEMARDMLSDDKLMRKWLREHSQYRTTEGEI